MGAFIKAEEVSIRDHFGKETYVQELLVSDPALLGLGNLVVIGKERKQSSSGRLDILLGSLDEKRWYEVEVQLGPTDETHIIKTIEYWDIERRQRPKISHTAVIVAEQITQRFFNVIALFNQHIPIIAIQMTALNVGGNHTIHFTKILDHSISAEAPEEIDYKPTDQAYWVKQASEASMKIADEILQFAKEKNPTAAFKYNQGYIRINLNGQLSHFVILRPRKKTVRVSFAIAKTASTDQEIIDQGFELEYDDDRQRYVLWISDGQFETQKAFIRKMVHRAYDYIDAVAGVSTLA
jgi:hypothetical protein